MSNGKILILTDGKAGHENQSKAFARALGREFVLAPVRFRSPLAKALSYLCDRLGIRTIKLLDCEIDRAKLRPKNSGPNKVDAENSGPEKGTEKCDRKGAEFAAVIGTGSGTFYAAKTLARKLGVKCGVVLYPRGYHLASFDCIMAPAFDRPKSAANVIAIPANLVANDAAFYDEGVEKFAEHYCAANGRHLDEHAPAVAVVIGGPNKCSTMTAAWMKAALDRVFAESKGARLWVTTSRRTPPDVEAVVEAYPWDYRLIYSKDHFNPIPAFVKLARRLYVTAESTGMLSESCTCGAAEVFALDNLKPGPHKFRRFVEGLIAGGYLNGCRKIDLGAEIARAKKLMGL